MPGVPSASTGDLVHPFSVFHVVCSVPVTLDVGRQKRDDTRRRLWTLHPKYLDAAGLVALWREALLAQKVLQGATKGYKHHPQLARFQGLPDPPATLAAFLAGVLEEAVRRDYQFDAAKIGSPRYVGTIEEIEGQLLYEWRHLKEKLRRRSPQRYDNCQLVDVPLPHPLLRIVAGDVRVWERMQK